ncbi:hypothetical protein A2547_02735 [candidate division WWE3 bacterium RIFOXYD2_FULL_43_10]|nr:MAG: hypothetical protein A2547_02735 [candidate division WWE3 bacterium RIFOXYD2_FULL_43_10]
MSDTRAGVSQAMASSKGRPKPSSSEILIKASAPENREARSSSGKKPGKRTFFSTPNFLGAL